MTTVSIPEIIAQLEACTAKDWRLDDLVNNITGQIRAVSVIGLNGRGTRRRYFGPKSHPKKGSAVPSPTKSPESRQRAAKALRRLTASHDHPVSEDGA